MAPGNEPSASSRLTPRAVLSRPPVSLCGGADMASALPAQAASRSRHHVERFPPLYRLLRLGCTPLLKWFFDLRVTGVEHLPPSGPFILAAKLHVYVDGVVLGVALPRPIAFLVMPRVFHASPLHPLFHRRLGSIPVNLERPDPGAIKRALRALEQGGVVGIFPEGPFSREGRLVWGQPGVAMIALRAGVPVVPAAISGTYEALAGRRFYIPRGRPLAVRFGHPLYFHQPRRRHVSH